MASSSITAASDSSSTKGSTASPPSPTPWTQIFAASADTELPDDPYRKAPISSDEVLAEASYSAADVTKKPVWNKPSNGALEVEPVMGADSWPALSEISQKSSADSSKSLPEASSLPLFQGTTGSASITQKQGTNNPHSNSSQNHAHPVRQKSFKRHGGNASGNNGSPTQPLPPPTLGQSASLPHNQNTSSSHKNFNLESVQMVASESQSHRTNDRTQHSNPHRRGNGPHQHGDSSYSHRYGARNDQDRPNREWNSQRNFNGRDVHPRATGALPRGIIRHIPMPHGSAPYVAPPLSPTVHPFGPPITYPEFPFYYVPVHPESIRGMSIPYSALAPHHMFVQYLDPELDSKVIHQIDYYFSNENLIKDTYLRKNMDEQGWVSIKLIAGFKKVMKLTDNIAFIMEAIRASTVVEVKDDKVRRRNDWMKWLMPESLEVPSQSTYLDPGKSSDFAARIQKINIDGWSSDIPSTTPQSGDPPLQTPSHTDHAAENSRGKQ